MATFPAARRNAMLNSETASHLSAWNGNPESGGTEVATSRTAATFGGAASGVRTMTTVNPLVPVGANAQVTHISVHSASSGGNLVSVQPLPGTLTFGAGGGDVRVTAYTLTLSNP
jgi:hypothetical protein